MRLHLMVKGSAYFDVLPAAIASTMPSANPGSPSASGTRVLSLASNGSPLSANQRLAARNDGSTSRSSTWWERPSVSERQLWLNTTVTSSGTIEGASAVPASSDNRNQKNP